MTWSPLQSSPALLALFTKLSGWPRECDKHTLLPCTSAESASWAMAVAWALPGEGRQCLWHVEGFYSSVQCFKQQSTASAASLKLHVRSWSSRRKADLGRQAIAFATLHLALSRKGCQAWFFWSSTCSERTNTILSASIRPWCITDPQTQVTSGVLPQEHQDITWKSWHKKSGQPRLQLLPCSRLKGIWIGLLRLKPVIHWSYKY